MKKILSYGIIIGVLTVSCEFEGVKSSDSENSSVVANNDTSETNLHDFTNNDSTESDKPYSLLKDSIQGTPNEMVYQHESGLRVEWTVKSEADPIKLNDVVMVNYDARVAAGEQFDSNKDYGKPVPLKTNIGMMVEGWEMGLLQMNIGDKGRIMIPNALAYGEDGYLTVVPPGADLIVEIEIVERVEPILLDEGVKVYKWHANSDGVAAEKNKRITFDYFAYTKGDDAHLYDNSYQNSQPFSFKLENDNVVDGLHQGMSILRDGENAFIEIPADLAYGSKGLANLVPANTDIVYDVRIGSID